MLGSLVATLTIFDTYYMKMMTDFKLFQNIVSVGLQDLWILTADQIESMEMAVKSLNQVKQIATLSAFISNFLSGGSIAVAQVMMIMGMVSILKYIPMNWPPNVIRQFTVKAVSLEYLFPFKFDDNVK